MHTIEPARLKPGVTAPNRCAKAPGTSTATSDAADPRQGADLLGSDEPAGDEVREEARRDRHRPDHACGRLRLREPRDARREVEGRFVPLSDAGLPRPGPPRRELRHRRRPVRHRLVARDEPGRAEGRRRRSRARDGRRRRQQHGRHLPPQQLQSRAARRPEPRGGGRRAGRRRVQLRSGHARSCATRRSTRTTSRCRCRRRKKRSAGAAASSPSDAASSSSRSSPRRPSTGRIPRSARR